MCVFSQTIPSSSPFSTSERCILNVPSRTREWCGDRKLPTPSLTHSLSVCLQPFLPLSPTTSRDDSLLFLIADSSTRASYSSGSVETGQCAGSDCGSDSCSTCTPFSQLEPRVRPPLPHLTGPKINPVLLQPSTADWCRFLYPPYRLNVTWTDPWTYLWCFK